MFFRFRPASTEVTGGDLVRGGIEGVGPSALQHLSSFFLQNLNSGRELLELEFTAHLLGLNWHWPEFDRYYRLFSDMGVYPYMWNVPAEKPDLEAPPVRQYWGAYRSLSVSARLILARNRLIGLSTERVVTAGDLKRDSGLTDEESSSGLTELRERGMLSSTTLQDRLGQLTIGELSRIARDRGLPVRRKKADLTADITDGIPERELKGLLPASAQVPSVKVNWLLPVFARSALEWELNRITLLVHTAMMTSNARRALKTAQEAEREYHVRHDYEPQIDGLRSCPICRKLEGKRLLLSRPDEWPPFHPGCRCSALPMLRY